ncbi:DUF3558 domain-containing protein [Nocardia sp. NPDC051570]|uniref:DUF3558 domain-containing protein n=1 Tax=Nocardia sp. NPDC051570 TaxID=3364324 RepID=UPI0037AC1B43
MRIATVCAAVLLTACSTHHHDAAQQSVEDPNFLAGCGPLPDQTIVDTVHATAVRPLGGPTICAWEADFSTGGPVDLTYAWLEHDTLGRDRQIDEQQGYRIEKLVIKHFGAIYVRDPRDPGSCAVTAADSGTVTWWVQNRDHTGQPDPCAAAMNLMQATLAIDGT